MVVVFLIDSTWYCCNLKLSRKIFRKHLEFSKNKKSGGGGWTSLHHQMSVSFHIKVHVVLKTSRSDVVDQSEFKFNISLLWWIILLSPSQWEVKVEEGNTGLYSKKTCLRLQVGQKLTLRHVNENRHTEKL